jgi:hypothetical protein
MPGTRSRTLGLAQGASRERLSFTTDMVQAVSQADLVQENGPERPEFKKKLFADIDAATPVDSLIASSSSGITPSVMQSQCEHPERILVGHPFNPPHLIPLVEVVGGARNLSRGAAAGHEVLCGHRQEADPAAQGDAGSSREPAADRALPRGPVPHRAERAERAAMRMPR